MNPIIIADDIQCMKILLEAGILDKLVVHPPHNKAVAVFKFRDYYGMATLDKDYPDPIDNGYTVVLIPKSILNMHQAASFFAQAIVATSVNIQPAEIDSVNPALS